MSVATGSEPPAKPPFVDPAGDEETRRRRGERNKASLEQMSPGERAGHDRIMGAMGAKPSSRNGKDPEPDAADPFAPLPPGSGKTSTPPDDETWEWHNPAPEPLPEPSAISWPGYGTATRTWVYRDAGGRPMFLVARFERPKKGAEGEVEKQTIPCSFGRRVWTTKAGNRMDKTQWHFKRPIAPVPLYGLDRLAARPDAQVLVCEGEKAADAAAVLFPEQVTIASQGGSSAPGKADWSVLADRQVAIWPDNDAPGEKYAKAAKAAIQAVGATHVAVVDIPKDWPEGWDVADDMPAGVTAEGLAEMIADAQRAAADPGRQAHDAIQAEVERLSRLPAAEYQVLRKDAALDLGIGVVSLDNLVKAEKQKRAAQAADAERMRPPPVVGEVRWPVGFSMKRGGLYCDTGGDGPPVWICPPFQVLGQGRDGNGEGWGLWLQWADPDGRIHHWAMPSRLLMVGPGELEGELVSRGLPISCDPAARALLRRALSEVRSGSRVITVEQPGWHSPLDGTPAYVMQDGTVIGQSDEAIVLRTMAENAAALVASSGTLEEWRDHVAGLAEGNDVAMFCICFGFAGPMMEVAQETSGGFHLFGRSKLGKTLAAGLAVTVWGTPRKGFILRDWRSTSNGMELAASDSNDGLLVLDEIHQVEPRELLAVVYMLANEAGKARARRDITAAKKKTWRVPILSTGEVDVASMAAKAHQPLTAGAQVRLPSLPVDAVTMWPELHEREDSRALMADLHAAGRKYHGTAGKAFLAKLTTSRAEAETDLADASEAMKERFARMLPPVSDQQVFDVARRCALVAFAGECAIEWGILAWPKDSAVKAARTMLKLWLQHRGGGGASEDTHHVRIIRLFLVTQGAARFIRISKSTNDGNRWVITNPERLVQNRAGWVHQTDDGRDEYYIDPDVWNEVCVEAGADPVETARTINKAGHLVTVTGAKSLTIPRTVPGVGRPRVYHVTPDLLGDKDD